MAYDNVCKFLIESFPTSYLSWLLEQPITVSPQILKTELPVEPVRADFVSFWQVGDRIVHVEFQTEPKQNVPLRMLNYFAPLRTLLGGLRFSKELLRGLFREEIVKESVLYQEILKEGKEEQKQLSQQEWVESLLLSKFGEIDPALARIIPSLVALSTEELAPLLLSADREQLLHRFGSEF